MFVIVVMRMIMCVIVRMGVIVAVTGHGSAFLRSVTAMRHGMCDITIPEFQEHSIKLAIDLAKLNRDETVRE